MKHDAEMVLNEAVTRVIYEMCVAASNLKTFNSINWIPMKKLKYSLICETLTWNDGIRCRADVYFFYNLD